MLPFLAYAIDHETNMSGECYRAEVLWTRENFAQIPDEVRFGGLPGFG